ncbi:MAG TPA: hypothetical protein VN457_03935, partial [Chlamydiales bacterium]|nr:hypothetical protein [Chlamydiales bacterium]
MISHIEPPSRPDPSAPAFAPAITPAIVSACLLNKAPSKRASSSPSTASFYLNPRVLRRLEKEVKGGNMDGIQRICSAVGSLSAYSFTRADPQPFTQLSDMTIRAWAQRQQQEQSDEKSEPLTKSSVQELVQRFQSSGVYAKKGIREELVLKCMDGTVRCNKELFMLFSDISLACVE